MTSRLEAFNDIPSSFIIMYYETSYRNSISLPRIVIRSQRKHLGEAPSSCLPCKSERNVINEVIHLRKMDSINPIPLVGGGLQDAVDQREQPWKRFADPTALRFAQMIANARDQTALGGQGTLEQYGAENGPNNQLFIGHYGAENGAGEDKPVDNREQPWKLFADPNAPQFAKIIAAAQKQTIFGVGEDALSQYGAENGG
ncbi:hypothetical protein TWF706_005880 [Orbilia oligospora]|nr:hypothetical protein TWF706_005880 [Orbilia oligospora]